MIADDDVERPIGKVRTGDVEMKVYSTRTKVRRYVAARFRGQTGTNKRFRREMENILCC
jgi:hypothetical protein